MKNKKIRVLVGLAVTFLASICASIGVWVFGVGAQDTAEPVLVGGEIEQEYLIGEYLTVPSAQITCGGKTLDAKIIVRKPDGELVQSTNVHLLQGGIYSIEYRAVFDGELKRVEKSFTVQTPLFSAQSNNSSAVFGDDDSQYQTGVKGVNLKMAEGDILTYNDVIDLNESDGDFLEFFLPPADGAGTSDLRKIIVTLTDVYDPNVALTVIMQCPSPSASGDLWYYDYTYVLAGGQNQTPTGFEVGTGKTHVGNDWGAPIRFSFYGMHGSNVVVGEETLKLTYDKATNAVYANGTKVIGLDDLNSFENAWNGFTTGEVRMTITGDKYNRPLANLLITRIGVNNLNQEILADVEAPEITVNYGEYDGADLPVAGKGYTYPVFDATAMDTAFGAVPVKTTVYYNYESNQRYQIAVEDGRFKTARAGYYTIEYLATDGYLNVGKKTVVVECKEAVPEISVEPFGEYATTGKTGELIFPADISYVGGTGEAETYATAKLADGEENLIEDGFRPEYAGTYTVTLYAKDMIGKRATSSYTVEVVANDVPVFLDEVVMPKYFLSGYNYKLPSLSAYDYSSGKEQITTTITVKDGGEERELADAVGKFVADDNGYATIVYNAVGKQGNAQKEYKVPVVNTWVTDETIDMSKYFYGEKITSVAEVDRIKVSSTEETEYNFITPVIAHKFETQFAITQNEFACLQLVFTDAEDENVYFTVEIEKSSDPAESSLLKINGIATRIRPDADFYNGKTFSFYYDDVNKILQDDGLLKQTVKFADGSVFGGFPSGKLYVTAKVIDVEGTAEIAWKNIGGQILCDTDADTIKPSLTISNDYKASYSLGELCEIYSAISADVLSPETYDSLIVYDPNGNVVVDMDGVELSGVPFDKSYFIELDYYGSYSVVYSSKDAAGREQTYYYAVYVADYIAPIISLQGETQTEVKLGKKINILKGIAEDNLDGEVPVYVYLVDPSGIIVKVENGGNYVATKKGVYEVRYMSIDSFGNLTIYTYQVTVV